MNTLEIILKNDSNPIEACTALLDYIQINMYEGNVSKVSEFYDQVPAILAKLFGTETGGGWIQSISNRFPTDIAVVYDLLAPAFGKMGTNLFRTMIFPAGSVPSYTVPITIFPEYTQYLIRTKQFTALSAFFHNLSERPEVQLKCLDRGCVALSPSEYYLTMFLYTIKQSKCRRDATVLVMDETNYISPPDIVISNLYANNPFLVLFARYVPSLLSVKRPRTSGVGLFDFLIMAIDELWLSESYNAEKLLPAKVDKLSPLYTPQPISPIKLPTITLLECLYALLYFLQQRIPVQTPYRPFGMDLYSTRQEYIHLEMLQHPLYVFLRTLIRYWNSQQAQSSYFSEVSLKDVSTLWLNYIRPWRESVVLDELFFSIEIREYNPNDPEYTIFLKQRQTKSEQNGLAWTDFIMSNILFYTDLFAEILRAYSYKKQYNSLDVQFLDTVKELYWLDTHDSVLGGAVPLSLLAQIAAGQGSATAYGDKIMKALNKAQGVSGKVLDPFHNVELKQIVRNILRKLDTARGGFFTGVVDPKSVIPDIKEKFAILFGIDLTQETTVQRAAEPRVGDFTEEIAGGIVPKKKPTKQARLHYTWDAPLAYYESWILFSLCYYLALFIEKYIKQSPVHYNRALKRHEPLGMPWFRAFASPKCAFMLILGIILLYLVIRFLI